MIAAVITFLVAVFTKESKVSEFRQQWIEALRDDISELISNFFYVAHEYEQLSNSADRSNAPIILDRIKPELMAIHRVYARIEMRLNPKEHQEFLNILTEFVKLSEYASKSAADKDAASRKMINASQKVLKAEWQVVKSGEATYRWVKRLSFFAAVATTFTSIYLVYLSHGFAL